VNHTSGRGTGIGALTRLLALGAETYPGGRTPQHVSTWPVMGMRAWGPAGSKRCVRCCTARVSQEMFAGLGGPGLRQPAEVADRVDHQRACTAPPPGVAREVLRPWRPSARRRGGPTAGPAVVPIRRPSSGDPDGPPRPGRPAARVLAAARACPGAELTWIDDVARRERADDRVSPRPGCRPTSG